MGDRKTRKALRGRRSTYRVMEEMRYGTPSTGRAFLSEEVPGELGQGQRAYTVLPTIR